MRVEKCALPNLIVGASVIRMLGGVLPMNLTVTAVDDKFVHCGDYKFDQLTGAEIDEDLGWTAEETGSYIVPA